MANWHPACECMIVSFIEPPPCTSLPLTTPPIFKFTPSYAVHRAGPPENPHAPKAGQAGAIEPRRRGFDLRRTEDRERVKPAARPAAGSPSAKFTGPMPQIAMMAGSGGRARRRRSAAFRRPGGRNCRRGRARRRPDRNPRRCCTTRCPRRRRKTDRWCSGAARS